VILGVLFLIFQNGVEGSGGLENLEKQNIRPDGCAMSYELQVKDTGKI
jgi:hypothetical protein